MSVWTGDPSEEGEKDFLERLLQSLNSRLEAVRARDRADDPPGVPLDLARELWELDIPRLVPAPDLCRLETARLET